MDNNDDDIKIVGDDISETLAARKSNGEAAMAEELEKAQSLGLFDRARKLGTSMARAFEDTDCPPFPSDTGIAEDETVHRQRRILLAFVAASGFEMYLESMLAANAALNAFYDALKEKDQSLYDHLSSTGAFTFYYLALRRGQNVKQNIGKAFAMLCGKDGDTAYAAYGEALFERFSNTVQAAVEEENK